MTKILAKQSITWSISTKYWGKVDKDKTQQLLTTGTLQKETIGFILDADKQTFQTNAIKARMEISPNDSKCRLFKATEETVAHIFSLCKKSDSG